VKNRKGYYEKFILPVQEARVTRVTHLRAKFEELRYQANIPGADLVAVIQKLKKIRGAIQKIKDSIQLEFEMPVAQRFPGPDRNRNYGDSRGIGIVRPGRHRKRSLH
jgi:hypothetical protein